MKAEERDVLRRLEEEAARLRDQVYPGDLMEHIRPRLAVRSQSRALRAWGSRLLLPAAVTLVFVTWIGQRRHTPLSLPSTAPPAAPSAASPGAVETVLTPRQNLSPFQTVRVPVLPVGRLPTLSAIGVPGLGTALSGGARALSQVRPPGLDFPEKEER